MGAIALNDAGQKLVARTEVRRFRVVDAETLEPVPGAVVEVQTDLGDWRTPHVARGRTNVGGRVAIRGVTSDPGPPYAAASAAGYLSSDSVPVRDGDRETTLKIYRAPAAMAGLIVPTGYHGVLRVDVTETTVAADASTPASFPKGQRVFWTQVVPGDQAATRFIPPPRLGASLSVSDVKVARFADSTPLPVAADAAPRPGVALWWLATQGEPPFLRVFYVGTHADAADVRNEVAGDKTLVLHRAWRTP